MTNARRRSLSKAARNLQRAGFRCGRQQDDRGSFIRKAIAEAEARRAGLSEIKILFHTMKGFWRHEGTLAKAEADRRFVAALGEVTTSLFARMDAEESAPPLTPPADNAPRD